MECALGHAGVGLAVAQVNTILLAADSLAANPMDPALHVALRMACFDANRLDDALVSFQQALMLNPDTAQAHYGIGRINDVPNPQVAIAAYERATALAPPDTEPIYRLGVLYTAGLGEYTNAVATFQRGLAHNSGRR